MAFGIIRARNLSAGDIAETDRHNARRYENENEYPNNIKADGKYYAYYESETIDDYIHRDETTLQEVIDRRLKENNVKGIRKNSNLAIEYVCTINDKKAWEAYSFSGYVSNTKKWIEERHGKGSVVGTFEHQDETNPHVHLVVVPLKEKQIKWKNQKGEGVRTETRLNTREFTGGRDKLRKLQDDYFQHLSDRYGVGENNKFRLPLYRGTKVEHQHREYSQQTNHEIALLRDEHKNSLENVRKLEIELEIAKKQAQMLEKETEYEIKKKVHDSKTRKNWKEKGTQQNKTTFHTERKKKGRGFSR